MHGAKCFKTKEVTGGERLDFCGTAAGIDTTSLKKMLDDFR